MATSSGRKATSSNSSKRSSGSARTGSSKPRADANIKKRPEPDEQQLEKDRAMFHEIGLIIVLVAMLILFFCNFGIIGPVGDAISGFMFGLFGLTAWVAPALLFIAVSFWFANSGSFNALRKLIAGCVLFAMAGVFCELISGNQDSMTGYSLSAIYEISRDTRSGGGVAAGSLCWLMRHFLDTIGTVLMMLLCSVVCLILLTEKSLISGVKKGSSKVREISREDAVRRREHAQARRQQQMDLRARREEERRLRAEEKENEKILRMEKKVSGVIFDTELPRQDENIHRDDVHEITFSGEEDGERIADGGEVIDYQKVHVRSSHQVTFGESGADAEPWPAAEPEPQDSFTGQHVRIHKEGIDEPPETEQNFSAPREESVFGGQPQRAVRESAPKEDMRPVSGASDAPRQERKNPAKYRFPSLSMLQKGQAVTGDSARELKETAMRLQQTLNTFGVKVTITDISQGPSVTRYELQPEQGVKVSKIVGLADDIKLNLAATDIRIEAPIPGKAAIGIEVPNKENMPVALRDLLESGEFQNFPSKIAFAVGKDIAGKVVVADIAKMPHMLIAGATGSGKSVCINTLIMSILYKAHPDEVKLIMVDPKVVELSVYNGIPHLLIPVVTDPKKASAALHWGVSEMEDRYRKFADFNVRDLKGYNKKVESMRDSGDAQAPAKLPQIVIIVDELADLMMVCPGEVEESICRLAQLARAAGIHLIIATQRPSVDVITGLIKANMPSRVAFSVSSGVDSRTILDMNGAEKLLGKGDMLFYPQGYSKPARIQGAFVSDKEVSDVVEFLKNQAIGNVYAEEIEEKIKNMGSGSGSGAGGGSGSDLDDREGGTRYHRAGG